MMPIKSRHVLTYNREKYCNAWSAQKPRASSYLHPRAKGVDDDYESVYCNNGQCQGRNVDGDALTEWKQDA